MNPGTLSAMTLAEDNPVFLASAGLALAALLTSCGHLAIAFVRTWPAEDDREKLRDIILLAGTANLVSLALAAIAWLGVAFLPFALIPYGSSAALMSKLNRLAPNTGDQVKAGAMNSIWLGGMSGWFLIALPALKEWPFLGEIALLITFLLCTFLNWGEFDRVVETRLQQEARSGWFRHAFAMQFHPGRALSFFFAIFMSGQARGNGLAGQEMLVAIIASVLAASAWHGTVRILYLKESSAGEFLARLGVGLGCLGAVFFGLPDSAVSLSAWTMAGICGALFGLFLIMMMILSAMHWFWTGRGASRQYHVISFLALIAAILAFILWLPVIQGASAFERLAVTSALCLVFASLPKDWVDWGGQQISGQPLGGRDGNCIGT